MTRRTIPLAAACLWLASGIGAAEAGKSRWSGFTPGSWALLRTVPVGGGPEMLTRWTLVSVQDDAATVEVSLDDGKSVSKREISMPIPDRPSHPDRVEEDVLKIKKKQLKCRVLVYEEQGVRIWESDEVPGYTVKTETPKSITTLVNFKAK